MKIYEYQGKEILRQFGVPTPRGIGCFIVAEAVAAAQQLGGRMKGEGATGLVLIPLAPKVRSLLSFPFPKFKEM